MRVFVRMHLKRAEAEPQQCCTRARTHQILRAGSNNNNNNKEFAPVHWKRNATSIEIAIYVRKIV
jgi:hypothetical protein